MLYDNRDQVTVFPLFRMAVALSKLVTGIC